MVKLMQPCVYKNIAPVFLQQSLFSINFRLQLIPINSSCFYVNVSRTLWSELDFESFSLERAKNAISMVVPDRKRISDNEVLVKILLPIFVGSVFMAACGLLLFAIK